MLQHKEKTRLKILESAKFLANHIAQTGTLNRNLDLSTLENSDPEHYQDFSPLVSLQLVEFFDVLDYPILGYTLPKVVTEFHAHLWSCAVDYR